MNDTDVAMARLSVCGFTTMDTTFGEDVELATRFGIGGIGICEAKLTDADDLARVDRAGLRATACVPANVSPLRPRPEGLYPGPADPDERTELMIGSLCRLAAFQPESIVFCTGSRADLDPADAERIAADALAAVAVVARELGVRISIEPIRDVGFDGSWLRTLPQTFDFLDRVGSDEVLVCFDVYHLWDTPDVLALARKHADRIGCVQLSDWHEPPRARADRLLPGDGDIDLAAVLGALEAGGYAGSYDVEIFSDDGRWGRAVPDSVWAMDPAEVFHRSVEGFLEAWNRRH